MRERLVVSALFLLASAVICTAQAPAGEGRYKLLVTQRTSTMEKEVNEAAAQGYRILVGGPAKVNMMTVFMERVATSAAPYKYRLLATKRTSTMQKELSEAADGGYRLVPSTMVFKGEEVVLFVELAPPGAKRYEYKLLETNRDSTLQKETAEAQDAGFVIVGMVVLNQYVVILEREVGK